jgi:hypothetical protein
MSRGLKYGCELVLVVSRGQVVVVVRLRFNDAVLACVGFRTGRLLYTRILLCTEFLLGLILAQAVASCSVNSLIEY